MGTKNDKVILNLKKDIENKKKLLAKIGRFTPITNCSLELFGSRYNIHTATKETLLFLIAGVKSMENGLKEVFPDEKLILSGYSTKDWITDLSVKFSNVNVKAEEERLKVLENKLHNLLSIDTKVEIEIDALKKEI